METNKTERILFGVFLVVFALIMGNQAANAQETDDGLWAARSCVGEAGFQSWVTGECAAMVWIYKKRANINGLGFYKTMRMYSGAIKKHPGHSRPWVFGLNRDGTKPADWPERLDWTRYRNDWLQTLETADKAISGEIPDPLPGALHYGGYCDRHRFGTNLIRLETEYRNIYFTVRGFKVLEPAKGGKR
jgi:hypothetical protein